MKIKPYVDFLFKKDVKTIFERVLTYSGPLRTLLIKYHARNSTNPNISIDANSIFSGNGFSGESIERNLSADGFSEGLHLRQDIVKEIHVLLKDKLAKAEGKEEFVRVDSGNIRPPILGIYNYYYNNLHLRNEIIDIIGRDKEIIKIVKNYLGANPILYFSKIWWSFARVDKDDIVRPQNNQKLFHYDVGDSKSLALFFYLTDVDENSGPHTTIKNTNKNRNLNNIINSRLSDSKAGKKYGNRMKTVVGTKGFGFFEDLLNYHKRSWALKPDPRLILMYLYTINRKPGTNGKFSE